MKSEESAKRVLESVTKYLERVNRDKRGTFRPYESVFLGNTFHRWDKTCLIVADKSVKRLKSKLKETYRRRSRTSLSKAIEKLTQLLKGWNYFKLNTRKECFEKLGVNIHTHLRCLKWRAWKRTRAREWHRRGLDAQTAWKSAYNGRGQWWSAKSLKMRIAIPNNLFVRLGLYFLLRQGPA